MLKLSDTIIGRPVLSLRTGRTVATITGAIINPNNLKIEGLYCTDSYDRSELVLLYQDIRDVLPQGFVINDHDVLARPKDLVRLKEFIDLGFDVKGKRVVTVAHRHLGKVADYAVEIETMYIQKLYVTQGFMKGLTGGNLGIDRSQVNEITDSKIIVFDPLDKATIRATATA
jgi:sporulation protein YlmC with PRC-barrel domain